MTNVKAWIEAMRLRTLPVSVAGVLMAVGCNIADGSFRPLPAVLCLVFAVLCQIASNFANEYYDYRDGRDKAGREGPRRGVTEGDLTPSAMKHATFILLGVAAIAGLSLTHWGGLWLIAAGAVIGLGALAYSAGPYPLSTHCLGEVAVILFFGIVPVNLTYYVQALAWSPEVFQASLAIGFLGANVLIINNYRDIPDDKAVGKHTLATVFGPTPVRLLYLLNSLLAVALTFRLWLSAGVAWLIAPGICLLVSILIFVFMGLRTGRALTPLLGMTAMNMFVFSLLFILSSIIS